MSLIMGENALLCGGNCIAFPVWYGTEAKIQLPLKRFSKFQFLCPNPSWLV